MCHDVTMIENSCGIKVSDHDVLNIEDQNATMMLT